MRIVIFGATGGTGRFVLRDAIGRGHDVTAFARRPDALAGVDGLAGIVQGDAREEGAAREAIAGQDAVIVTVSGRGQPDVVRDVARAVISAMASQGVSRLVMTSAYGMVAVKPLLAAGLVRRIFAKPFADQATADEIVRASDLNWTIARATRLTNGAVAAPARMSTELFTRGPYSINRASWAKVLVDLAGGADRVRQIVNVTG
jgi:uncharacterized protein YbjT (DUF2867 family)